MFIKEMVGNLYLIYEPTVGYYFILTHMGGLAPSMIPWQVSLQIVGSRIYLFF